MRTCPDWNPPTNKDMRKALLHPPLKPVRLRILGLDFDGKEIYLDRRVELPVFEDDPEEGTVEEQRTAYIDIHYDELVWGYVRRVTLSFREVTGYEVRQAKKSAKLANIDPVQVAIQNYVRAARAAGIAKDEQVLSVYDVFMRLSRPEEEAVPAPGALVKAPDKYDKLRIEFEAVLGHLWKDIQHLPPVDIWKIVMNGVHLGLKVNMRTMATFRIGGIQNLKGGLFQKNLGLSEGDYQKVSTLLGSFTPKLLPETTTPETNG